MRFQTLDQWLSWQTCLRPLEIELGLERVGEVWGRMHEGPFPAPVISVAGTNGKGSCTAFLDAILRAGGYRTGCYTSPHLVRYNERIRVDGQLQSDRGICRAFEQVDKVRDGIELTYFEFGTLAALGIFLQQRLDVIILEVGLGGRLDAVNIVDADVALITTVDIDHREWLGDSREKIAVEKAGIMRAQTPAVFGGVDPPKSLIGHAKKLGAPLYLAGRDFRFRHATEGWEWLGPDEKRGALPFPHLRGDYQLENASAVLMTLSLLRERLPVDQAAVRSGLQKASVQGRFQVTGGQPVVILDVAHNPQAARALAGNLRQMPCSGRTLAVFGMLSDKDVEGVVAIMAPWVDHWFAVTLEDRRGLSAETLVARMKDSGVENRCISTFRNPLEAVQAARQAARVEDRVLVFGSFHLVGDVLECCS